MRNDSTARIGVIGTGDWGRNHLRAFARVDDCTVVSLSDSSSEALQKALAIAPDAQIATTPADLFRAVDAVVVATPAETHFELACAALRAGKHVLVEKPFVLRLDEASEVIELAAAMQRTLMVGHLLLHHPVVREMKRRIDADEIGELLYLYSTRINFGKVRSHENALWSFAPHDISTMNYLVGKQPITVQAVGQSFIHRGVEDVVFFSLQYESDTLAHGQVSWLDPHKRRSLVVVGRKKMLAFDDVQPKEKLVMHDKRVDRDLSYESYEEYVKLRVGESEVIDVPLDEPLKLQARAFLESIRTGKAPLNDGGEALRVLEVLHACDRSLQNGGRSIRLGEMDGQ